MANRKCSQCNSETKDLKDLFRAIEKNAEYREEIFWCPFCGALEDLNRVDCYVHKPLILSPKKYKVSAIN
jgi:hypothetical protein